MSAHTPGRLRSEYPIVYAESGAELLHIDEYDCATVHDARRLAACWNAFDGLPTEVVEQIHGLQAYHAEMKDNIAEKSELLARSVAMLGEASGHVGEVEAERDHALSQLSAEKADSRAIDANYEAARALLAEVLSFGLYQPPEDHMDDEGVDLTNRIRQFLEPKP